MAVQGSRRKKKRRSALYAPLAFLLICGAIAFALSIFFRVSEIETDGDSRYTAEEIIEASGIEKGDNLFFINRFKSMSRIRSKLTYADDVQINCSMPNRVTITVNDTEAIAYIENENRFWHIDANCKLLEVGGSAEAAHLIGVSGITPLAPAVGDELSVGADESGKKEYLSELLGAMEAKEMADKVGSIDLSSTVNAVFDYDGRFEVKLGRDENIEYKLELLLSAVEQLPGNNSGTIDLSIDKKAHFSPD